MIDYSAYRSSLTRLQEQYENLENLDPGLSKLTRDGVAESVLRRFKICYDRQWKVLKRYLNEELGIAETPNSPKPILRLANENNLFASSIDQWLRYANARIDTSHDYDAEKAKACLVLIPCFIDDAIALYQKISDSTWK